jgi:hypothetical protein
MPTHTDVAIWMKEEIGQRGFLAQADAVEDILAQFGQEFLYEKETGSVGISWQVMDDFRELTEGVIVWDGRRKGWRLRESSDDRRVIRWQSA